jgi:Family of unknown function (DUF5670)
MLWIVIVVLVLFWLFGFWYHLFGDMIHIVLLVAVVLMLVSLLRGRTGPT